MRLPDYAGSQTLSTQVAPPVQAEHADVQRALSESEAQVLSPQRWKPVLHAGTHDVPLQVTVPLVGTGHTVHAAPHASAVLFGTHVGACAVPRRQKPGALHTTRQLRLPGVVTLSQAAMPLEDGAGHVVHELPQLAGERSDTHRPVPAGQR
jgi:hypothetical protein